MNGDGLFLALLGAAVSIGAIHTAAPDHWAPFAAASRAHRWSARHTVKVTILCGTGHVGTSALLGLGALLVGLEAMKFLGESMASVAGGVLIAFGLAWAAWGIGQPARHALHGHGSHAHHHHGGHGHGHVHAPSRLTEASLFAFFALDPCIAVPPLLFAAAPLGAVRTAAVLAAYEMATVGTMLALVLPARAGVLALRFPWMDRWADALAGGFIASVGTAVLLIGM